MAAMMATTMMAANRYDHEFSVNLAISLKYAVAFSRFHCCGHHGIPCGRHGLWPSWFVAVMVCGRHGLWPSWFVAVMVCGRHGQGPLVTVWIIFANEACGYICFSLSR